MSCEYCGRNKFINGRCKNCGRSESIAFQCERCTALTAASPDGHLCPPCHKHIEQMTARYKATGAISTERVN